MLTPQLDIAGASDSYLRATHTTRAAIVGRYIFDVFPDNPSDVDATGVANLQASLDRVIRFRTPDAMAVQKYDVRREDGTFEERYWSPINFPVLDTHAHIASILHRVEDVTAFVRLEARGEEQAREIMRRGQELQVVNHSLRMLNADLEERVEIRTRELARANEELREEVEQSHRLEEQIQRARRLEAIGTLAGGVAHDFNNLLTVINGYCSLLLDKFNDDGETRGRLLEMQRAGLRAAGLTRQLLAFSRRQVLTPHVISLNTVVTDIERMLRRMIGEDIAVVMDLDPSVGNILADSGQVEQIVMNLAVNARDAMPEGGRLTIASRWKDLTSTLSTSIGQAPPGRYAQLTVTDTGCGMDDDVKARLFEPFFTTKPLGRGTGLGLSTVFGIVQQSGGFIAVESELHNGTAFSILFPSVDTPADSPTSPSHVPQRGSGTILLVEYDEPVRTLNARSLRSYGYDVIEAVDGPSAIQLSSSHPGPIDLLLTDVVMPEMGGRRLAEAIIEQRPQVKVLYVSGYTDDEMLRQGILHHEVAFLQKPFLPATLVQMVQDLLPQTE